MDDNEKKPVERPTLCRIEIMFQVTSDEQALKIKSDISENLKALDKKQFRFTIVEG